jgi:hypothetical protein
MRKERGGDLRREKAEDDEIIPLERVTDRGRNDNAP